MPCAEDRASCCQGLGLPGRVGKLLLFLLCLVALYPHPALTLSSPAGRAAVNLEQERRKRCTRVQGLLFIYIKTLPSATVPALSKQQLPVQAGLCLQTCVLRPPHFALGGAAPREAELGSQLLLPLLWECCWQLLSLPALPLPSAKNTPYPTCKEGPAAPGGPGTAPELRPGNKLLYSTCRAARTCRVRVWLSGGRGGCPCPGAAAGLGGGGACSWSGRRAGRRC